MKRPAQVRADFILKLQQEGQRLPRRQEAESAYVDGRTALVTHEEVRAATCTSLFVPLIVNFWRSKPGPLARRLKAPR